MYRSLFGACLVLSAAPAAAEVVSTTDAGFVIKLSADAQADRSEAWKVLIAPSRWWSGDHTYSGDAANLWIDAQATGCFCEKIPRPKDAPETQRIGSVEHMHVVYSDPQAGVLRMTGGLGPLQQDAGSGTLTIKLNPTGQGTRFDWVYVVSGLGVLKPQEIAAQVDKVLGEQLGRLASKAVPTTPQEDKAKAED
ncbi:MAG: SRPBCC family protein [Novosphingobium sp.]|jgi:hypothetical protein|nr:SRPBCC family protein [Novosphingobium sp.]